MADFNANDVKEVAEALLENWWNYDEGGRNAYFECKYCSGSVNAWKLQPKDIQHESSCVVLIAKDLLTGL